MKNRKMSLLMRLGAPLLPVLTLTLSYSQAKALDRASSEDSSAGLTVTEALVNDTPENKSYTIEETAVFPGGLQALMQWLCINIRYPEQMVKDNISGKVIVRFTISEEGKVSDPVVIRGVCPEADAEAIRLVSKLPDWIPARNGDTPVSSTFVLPITFQLPTPSSEE